MFLQYSKIPLQYEAGFLKVEYFVLATTPNEKIHCLVLAAIYFPRL
jgi:hypothetical protein